MENNINKISLFYFRKYFELPNQIYYENGEKILINNFLLINYILFFTVKFKYKH